MGKTFFNVNFMESQEKKILFYAPIFDYPTKDGPSISVSNAIKVLSKTSKLFIVAQKDKKSKNFSSSHQYFSLICKNIIFIENKFKCSLNNVLLKRIFTKITIPLNSIFHTISILNLIKSENINIIWIDRIIEKSFFVFLYLDFLRKAFRLKYKLIADNESVYSSFILRELQFVEKNSIRYFLVKTNGLICRIYEKYMLKTANVVTAVSEFDKCIYKSINHLSNIKLFSNTIDLDLYEKKYASNLKIKEKSVLLLGHFGNETSPMNRALIWLLEEIMPIVWDADPDIHLYIVGKNAPNLNYKNFAKNITISRNVPSTIPYLQRCKVHVIPLKHESGTRFKIIEAGASKIPCISTKLGAEGLNVVNKRDIIITDNEKEFAENIHNLIYDNEFSNFLSNNLYELVKSKYTLKKQLTEANEIINSLM